MPKALNLTGERFGSLVALNKEKSQNGKTYWKFRCDCGNEKIIQTGHVTTGAIKTCGCGIHPVIEKNQELIFGIKEIKKCLICGKEFLVDNFGQIKRKYCIECSPSGSDPIPKYKAMKKRAIEMMGGKCQLCGYNRCLDALEFHHIDPSQKEFSICDYVSFERFLKEIEKCQLLCANCHREEHWRLRND